MLFLRRLLMHYGIYRRYPLGRLPALVMHGAPLSPKTRYTAAKRTLGEPKKRRTSVGKLA
jgi:hypothetical protein